MRKSYKKLPVFFNAVCDRRNLRVNAGRSKVAVFEKRTGYWMQGRCAGSSPRSLICLSAWEELCTVEGRTHDLCD